MCRIICWLCLILAILVPLDASHLLQRTWGHSTWLNQNLETNTHITQHKHTLSPTHTNTQHKHTNTQYKSIHFAQEIHEHFLMRWGHGTLSTFKHIFIYIETIVTNCVNDMIHTDELTAHWAHCAPCVDESFNLFTPSPWVKGLAVFFHLIHGHSHAHWCWSVFFSHSFLPLSQVRFPRFLDSYHGGLMTTPCIDFCTVSPSGAWSVCIVSHPNRL